MIVRPGDEVRAAERIARLIGRYAERFDPFSRSEFYRSVAEKTGRLHQEEAGFIHGDDLAIGKKPPAMAPRKDAGRRSA